MQAIETAQTEDTRRLRFMLFVNRVIKLDLVNTEKRVNVVYKTKTTSERIDLCYGTLVMEFKKSIQDSKQAEAQLCRYVSGLLNEERHDYTLVATDGIRFKIYNYQIVSDRAVLYPDDVELGLASYINVKERSVNNAVLSDEIIISKIREFVIQQEIPKISAKDAPALFQPKHSLYTRCMEVLNGVDETVYHIPFNEWKKYQDVVYGNFQSVSGNAQRVMFLNHTYMATVAKIITHTLTIPNSDDDIDDIILGTSFTNARIGNFVENDFFSWVITHSGMQ